MADKLPKRLETTIEPPEDPAEFPEYGWLNDELIELFEVEQRLKPEALHHVIVDFGGDNSQRIYRAAGIETRENKSNPDSITVLL